MSVPATTEGGFDNVGTTVYPLGWKHGPCLQGCKPNLGSQRIHCVDHHCHRSGAFPTVIIFIIGFLLTLFNTNGILFGSKMWVPLHWLGTITGCLLMAQSVNQLA
jgi:hypothetical protein